MERSVNLYIAADVLDDQRLRNACVDYFMEVGDSVCKVAPTKVVSVAYGATTDGSLLRKAMVDQYYDLNEKGAARFKARSQELPQQFLADMVYVKLQDGKTTRSKSGNDPCRYHEHNDEVPECVKS